MLHVPCVGFENYSSADNVARRISERGKDAASRWVRPACRGVVVWANGRCWQKRQRCTHWPECPLTWRCARRVLWTPVKHKFLSLRFGATGLLLFEGEKWTNSRIVKTVMGHFRVCGFHVGNVGVKKADVNVKIFAVDVKLNMWSGVKNRRQPSRRQINWRASPMPKPHLEDSFHRQGHRFRKGPDEARAVAEATWSLKSERRLSETNTPCCSPQGKKMDAQFKLKRNWDFSMQQRKSEVN